MALTRGLPITNARDWQQEYDRKLMSLDACLDAFVPDGSKVFCGLFEIAGGVIRPMLERINDGRLSGIQMYGGITTEPLYLDQVKVTPEQLRYHGVFTGANERAGMTVGTTTYVPVHLHSVGDLFERENIDVAVIPMSPPDKHGYCNIGQVGCRPEAIRCAKKVIAQINPSTPWVYGLERNVHVSQIDAFVEIDQPMTVFQQKEAGAAERAIADYCAELICDGACLQVGYGTIGNAVLEALSSHKHLGCHTEMYGDGMARLQEAGVMDNAAKNYFPGSSVVGFALGTQYLYDFIDHNPGFCFTPFRHVNDPAIIARNDNMHAINSAMTVDLTGQICAESIGHRQYSGVGGQVDFVRGAMNSKGGKSIIAMTSLATTKNGPISKIVPYFKPGTITTTLRTDAQYVVTEHGVVNLQYKDIPERVKLLVSIAHPDFRDELIFEAKKHGYLY